MSDFRTIRTHDGRTIVTSAFVTNNEIDEALRGPVVPMSLSRFSAIAFSVAIVVGLILGAIL